MARTSVIGMDVSNEADGGYFVSNSSVSNRKISWSGADVNFVGQQDAVITMPNYADSTLFAHEDLTEKGDIISASDAGVPEVVNVGADGQLLTADSNEDSGLAWKSYTLMTSESVSADATLQPNKSYIIDESGDLINLTLPATMAKGQVIRLICINSAGYKLLQNASQICHVFPLSTTEGETGSISGNQYTAIYIECVSADTEFMISVESGTVEVV